MKKNKIYIFALLIIVAALMGQCSSDPIHEYISKTSKEFLSFKQGSNWLYQEDSTGIEQHFYVDQWNTSEGTIQIDQRDHLREGIAMKLKSNDTSTCTQTIGPFFFAIEESYKDKYKSNFYKDNAYEYNFSDNKLKDTIILGVTYKDVSHVIDNQVRYTGTEKSYICEYWIAKNIWVVKKIIRTPTKNWYWSLKKCTIVQ